MRFTRSSKALFGVGALLLMTLALPAAVAAADTSADTLRTQLEQDQKALDSLYVHLDEFVKSGSSASRSNLQADAKNFTNSALAYRSMVFSDSSLRKASQQAASGAVGTQKGVTAFLAAVARGNSAASRSAASQVDSGASQLDEAIASYNVYVDSKPQPWSIANLGKSPFGFAIWFVPGVVGLGLYLLVAGFLMNLAFGSRLNSLVRGSSAPQAVTKGILPNLYGAHLLLLVALAYLVLFLGVVLVLLFGIGLGLLILQLPRIPVAALLAVPVVVFLSLWAVVKGFMGTRAPEPFGNFVDPLQEPRLWEINRQVAVEVGTRVSDDLILSPLSGISVHEEGGLFSLLFGRTRRVLTVGAPSIVDISTTQFKAILGHEYGHLANRDTGWSSLTYRAGSAARETLRTMNETARSGGWVGLLSAINPARWAIFAYLILFGFVTSGFSRMREVLADAVAVQLYGAAPFATGLQSVVENDQMFATMAIATLISASKQGKPLSNVYASMSITKSELNDEERSSLLSTGIARKPSAFDSHPPVTDRLRYAERFENGKATPRDSEQGPLTDLLVDWNVTAWGLTQLLNQRARYV